MVITIVNIAYITLWPWPLGHSHKTRTDNGSEPRSTSSMHQACKLCAEVKMALKWHYANLKWPDADSKGYSSPAVCAGSSVCGGHEMAGYGYLRHTCRWMTLHVCRLHAGRQQLDAGSRASWSCERRDRQQLNSRPCPSLASALRRGVAIPCGLTGAGSWVGAPRPSRRGAGSR